MRKGSFQSGLFDFSKEAQEKTRRNVRKVLVASLGGVIGSSPVDTGSFRLNWNIQAKSPNDETKDVSDKTVGDSPKPASVQEIAPAESVRFELGDMVYISNALPYANRIESGWSQQARQGVVAPVIREMEDKIRKGALD